MSDGEVLTGDGVTEGIVRIGDTVRRPLRPFSLTVQAYLAHLHGAGFTAAPRPLGVDEHGREMLSFVPGEVHRHPLPPQAAGDDRFRPRPGLLHPALTSRTRCGSGRRSNGPIRGTGRPHWPTPASPAGSRSSRTPTA